MRLADPSVRSLQVSPIDDTFISAGDDGTVRMWDLRLPECKVRPATARAWILTSRES